MSSPDEWEAFCVEPAITGLIDAMVRLCNLRLALYYANGMVSASARQASELRGKVRTLGRTVIGLSLSASAEVNDITDAPSLHADICKYVDTIQCGAQTLRMQLDERKNLERLVPRLEVLEALKWPEIAAARSRMKERLSKPVDEWLDSEDLAGGSAALEKFSTESPVAYEQFCREVASIKASRSRKAADASSVQPRLREGRADSAGDQVIESFEAALTPNQSRVLQTMALFDSGDLVSAKMIVEEMDPARRLSEETVRLCINRLVEVDLAERPPPGRSGARLTRRGRIRAGKIAD